MAEPRPASDPLPRALPTILASRGTHGRPAQGQVLLGQTQAHGRQVCTWLGFQEGSRGSGQVRTSPLAEAISWAALAGVAGAGTRGTAVVRQAQTQNEKVGKMGHRRPRPGAAMQFANTLLSPRTPSLPKIPRIGEIQGPAKATRSPRPPTAQTQSLGPRWVLVESTASVSFLVLG